MNNTQEKKTIQQLIELGKTKGFLTYEEVNDFLPEEMVSSDRIDDLLDVLTGEQIEVIDRGDAAQFGKNRENEESGPGVDMEKNAAET